ncbi:antibiotic biosynthesis monooxygenase family protein [Myceligenerans crystallogenes]|uniref:ABM domain-containing protein n=1 Tax=Myceligenerans crystallogenes TaxID=316335 RepID=A0ABN2N998_9MICO
MTAPVTFVNIIEVEPEKQQEAIEILKEGTEKVISQQPGFVSLELLASADGKRVLNVARWESVDALKAVQTNPEAGEYVKQLLAVATATPGPYQVVATY